jgi:hypothetical protein
MNVVVTMVMHPMVKKKSQLIFEYQSFISGDYNQIYAAVNGSQVCQIYDQCAANNIDCGAGLCSNQTSAQSTPCYCNSPLVLIEFSAQKYDCVCPSNTYYYSGGVCIPRPEPDRGNI